MTAVSGILLLTQFNNCSGYEAPVSELENASLVTCTNSTCVDLHPEYLSARVNALSGGFGVPANLSEFNLGGDCNEGGYPSNIVHWDLMLNGVSVRNSSQGIAGGASADSRCVNGRFMLYINLEPITQDPVNRKGLSNGTIRTSYTLNITIYGLTGSGVDPSISARSSVPLQVL